GYKSASGDVAITISQADASITVNGYTGVYDVNAHAAPDSGKGGEWGALGSLPDLGTSFTGAPGGSAHWTFAGNTDYKSASGDVRSEERRAGEGSTANGYTGVYDGNAHAATGSGKGVKLEDLSSLPDPATSITAATG